MAKVFRVCAWCKKDVGVIESDEFNEYSDEPSDRLETHTICSDCLADMQNDI